MSQQKWKKQFKMPEFGLIKEMNTNVKCTCKKVGVKDIFLCENKVRKQFSLGRATK